MATRRGRKRKAIEKRGPKRTRRRGKNEEKKRHRR